MGADAPVPMRTLVSFWFIEDKLKQFLLVEEVFRGKTGLFVVVIRTLVLHVKIQTYIIACSAMK